MYPTTFKISMVLDTLLGISIEHTWDIIITNTPTFSRGIVGNSINSTGYALAWLVTREAQPKSSIFAHAFLYIFH